MNVPAPAKLVAVALALATLLSGSAAHAQTTKLRVGICARTVSMGVGSPFAIAMKLGWFKQEGIDVEIVPLPGSTDCVKSVATGQLLITLPSVEPLAIVRPQGIKAKIFYTAYQTNGYGLAVPVDSPIQKAADLKGKNIGVTSLASAGVVVARAQVAAAGLDPDRDVNIVVAGEGAQPAALLRSRQVDALSQFDTQYALIANAGVPMRYLDRSQIERFPGNGFLALEDSLKTRRKELVGLGRAYAKGTIFTLNNPEAAVRIVYEVFPETRPTGKDEATAIREDVKVLEARMPHFLLEPAGVKRWGESSEVNYRDYIDFLVKWGVLKQKVETSDLITNELIEEINRLDVKKVAADARAYTYTK
ncbi:MAG TPA: ABC transporter substrate-binding protein [Candidatus Bathyarchaeia archaeon]|nr:ABC transporter substrate-binding protein [Candidatus Bathyarchaeia archaeon]